MNRGFDAGIEFGFVDIFGGADINDDDVFFGDLSFCPVVSADFST